MYFLGTDEAGYGPNLGPLVIAVTVWHVPDDVTLERLDDHLATCIARTVAPRGKVDPRLLIADSKKLYDPARGLALLEQQVQRAMRLAGIAAGNWRECWDVLAPRECAVLDGTPWHDSYDEPLPVAAAPVDDVELSGLAELLKGCGAQLSSLRARVVFPDEFNQLLDRYESKGSLLSNLTIELLCRALRDLPDGAALAICDKHGARNHYAPLLQSHVDDWIEVLCESAAESRYRWGSDPRRVELRLQPRCEEHLPTALASMVAKYLRELAMRAFNRFWCEQIDGLKPTAGYATDARRFQRDIRTTQQKLGIQDQVLWRRK